ncbi:DUF2164 family protein [Candidatus Nomurabacteria bacterium]|nr:DUF2164 family protein [Candidatus Nomurabacteria bacterium]
MTKTNFDGLNQEQRRGAIDKIISFFAEERDEEIGVIAAEQLLDFFLDEIGKSVYNNGIDATGATIKEQHENLLMNIEALKRQ